MNRERRKIVANIFGDAAKYTLTVGTIGSIITGKLTLSTGIVFGIAFAVFLVFAYFVTPEDKKEDTL